MDCKKTGDMIRRLRLENGLTQLQLAAKLNISDKAVSKWERACGCPDLSLLPELSEILGVELINLLNGDLDEQDAVGGNMKKTRFSICPQCGNVVISTGEADISCCGKRLKPAQAVKAEQDERLSVELIENDWYISSAHDMTKEHYISFAALLTGDTVMMRKMYPEWGMQTRIPMIGHGKLVWYCTKHGLMWQPI